MSKKKRTCPDTEDQSFILKDVITEVNTLILVCFDVQYLRGNVSNCQIGF